MKILALPNQSRKQCILLLEMMINCASDNIGSEKTILACSAVFQDEVLNEEGEKLKRFWIRSNTV